MYKEKIDKMTWSFSRVNAYETCPKMFFLQYLDKKVPRIENAFAEWGSLIHSILERFYRGELMSFELMDTYKEEYSTAMTTKFPPNKWKDLNKAYYDAGIEYLSIIEDLPERYEVISVEEKITVAIGKFKFTGYIDLVLRDRETGEIVIVDHKSKNGFASEQEKQEYLRQLYLYAIYVKQQYGEYPARLTFNMFRKGEIVKEKFELSALESAEKWFLETINKIYSDEKFSDKITISYSAQNKKISEYKGNDFFCCYLCSVRNGCNRNGLRKRVKKSPKQQ